MFNDQRQRKLKIKKEKCILSVLYRPRVIQLSVSLHTILNLFKNASLLTILNLLKTKRLLTFDSYEKFFFPTEFLQLKF